MKTITAHASVVPEIDAWPVMARLSSDPRMKPKMTSSVVVRLMMRLLPRRMAARPMR